MANVKSLIIINPMSAPLQKLYEVLSASAAEENIEITVINNINETKQLFSMGGQYLTLISDPKTCAIFLQENKAGQLTKHTKTLLFTPKPLPVKILDKFVKLGLTENIMDTAAPKTLLYKVKLLLKSIKSNEDKETKEKKEQVVKTMLDTSIESTEELALIHKEGTEEAQPAYTDEKKKKKFSLEEAEGLDYLKDLKKKKTYQEEAIQTNWKSTRDTTLSETIADEMNTGKNQDQNQDDDIDNYYRGKTKKVSLEIVESEEIKKKSKVEFDETDDTEQKTRTKKESVEIELTEGIQKTRTIKALEEEEESNSKSKQQKSTEVEIQFDKKNSNKKIQLEEDEANSREKLKKEQTNIELADSEDKKLKPTNTDIENTDDMLKGKIKSKGNIEIELEEGKLKTKEEVAIAEKEAKSRKIATELELDDDKHAKKESTNTETDEKDELRRKKINELENLVDEQLDKAKEDSDNENIEDRETKKKKLNTKIELIDEKLSNSDSEDSEELEEIAKKKRPNSAKLELDELQKEKKVKSIEEDDDGDFNRKKIAQTAGAISSVDEKKEKSLEEEIDENRKKRAYLKDMELAEAKDKENKRNAMLAENEDNLKSKSKGLTELEIDPSKKRNDGNNVDEIDKYMRGGSAKNADQDWTQKRKTKDITLELNFSSKDEIEVKKKEKRDLGEQTIDYRMLKEQFAEMERTGSSTGDPENKSRAKAIAEDEEDTSFKVIELKANGFDFAINIINQYYNPEVKVANIYKSIAQKLLTEEKAFCSFFTYLNFSKEHQETYNGFQEFQPGPMQYWEEFKKEQSNLDYIYSKTMSTWVCRGIPDKESFWSDNELPTWAPQELTNRVVEYIYPFYDGLDRMGMAYLYFPEGIRPQSEKKILVLIELLRGVFLETVQRNSTNNNTTNKEKENEEQKTGNVLSMFGNLFGKKKTG